MVTQQLDQLSVIGRCEYSKTCTLLVQLFDQAAQAYQEMVANINTVKIEETIQEGKKKIDLEFASMFTVVLSWFRPTHLACLHHRSCRRRSRLVQ